MPSREGMSSGPQIVRLDLEIFSINVKVRLKTVCRMAQNVAASVLHVPSELLPGAHCASTRIDLANALSTFGKHRECPIRPHVEDGLHSGWTSDLISSTCPKHRNWFLQGMQERVEVESHRAFNLLHAKPVPTIAPRPPAETPERVLQWAKEGFCV